MYWIVCICHTRLHLKDLPVLCTCWYSSTFDCYHWGKENKRNTRRLLLYCGMMVNEHNKLEQKALHRQNDQCRWIAYPGQENWKKKIKTKKHFLKCWFLLQQSWRQWRRCQVNSRRSQSSTVEVGALSQTVMFLMCARSQLHKPQLFLILLIYLCLLFKRFRYCFVFHWITYLFFPVLLEKLMRCIFSHWTLARLNLRKLQSVRIVDQE